MTCGNAKNHYNPSDLTSLKSLGPSLKSLVPSRKPIKWRLESQVTDSSPQLGWSATLGLRYSGSCSIQFYMVNHIRSIALAIQSIWLTT